MAIFLIRDEGKMTAEQLKRNLDLLDIVEAQVGGGCGDVVQIKRTTHRDSGIPCYEMWGKTGTHCLSIDSTAERILTHWRGFVQNNRDRSWM